MPQESLLTPQLYPWGTLWDTFQNSFFFFGLVGSENNVKDNMGINQ